jgi:hypothetical protein
MTATRERFDVEAERRTLGAMTAGELRRRYQEVGGDEARSRNREYLIRRILWMLQSCNRRSLDLQSADLELTIRGCPPITCSRASLPGLLKRPCRIRQWC